MRRSFPHRIFRPSLAVAIIAGSISITLFGLNALYQVKNDPAVPYVKTQVVATPIKPNPKVYSFPSRLIIPKLSVNTNVVPMGVTATGNMEAPLTNQAAGWYTYGARPGNVGSAVIDGHLGLSSEAVFGKLDQLVPGDIFSVIDDQGSTITFTVKRTATFEKNSDATDIFNSSGGSHLNLITCNGDWESHQATYSRRLVVFSDAVIQLAR